jgi:pilus assembly protein Flp/PilA
MLMNLMNYVSSKVKNEEGQGMVEYALLVGLIAVVVIVGAAALGVNIGDQFTAIGDKLAALVP